MRDAIEKAVILLLLILATGLGAGCGLAQRREPKRGAYIYRQHLVADGAGGFFVIDRHPEHLKEVPNAPATVQPPALKAPKAMKK